MVYPHTVCLHWCRVETSAQLQACLQIYVRAIRLEGSVLLSIVTSKTRRG